MSGVETDLDKALAALRSLKSTCAAATSDLQQPFSAAQTALLPERPALAVLQKDFQALLTLIYTSSTKVSLVLRPATHAPSAALAPISDLGTAVTSLATCATLFGLHGATLASDVRRLARDVCEGVRALAEGFAGGEGGGEDYLVRTGAVHDLVERARKDIPASNLAAVKARWKSDREMIADSAAEIDAMVEDPAGAGDEFGDAGFGDDGFDEEWDELGLGTSKKMSEVEIERTKKIQPLVRFVTLLHKRVVPDVLNVLPRPSSDLVIFNEALDALPAHSHAQVLAIEDLVAALYAPQKPDVLATAVSSLVTAARRIYDSISTEIFQPSPDTPDTTTDMTKALEGLSIGTSKGTAEKPKDARRWFANCMVQIEKTAKSVEAMLSSQLTNAT